MCGLGGLVCGLGGLDDTEDRRRAEVVRTWRGCQMIREVAGVTLAANGRRVGCITVIDPVAMVMHV